ncbi:GNAT family N-acetyltransferase [Stappia sp. ES.058]|uniref:GNAT family N-acetyltransferase n=1 Tax=Stappia sp. ES.058 TaxID=1881061 RepID=UPI00087CABB2|nr:GNAT family N-acetyltransferase [Stappia sp. ES.058]SDU23806.1 Acetyltransferase involved in cellulose biosynthesis, CelD/BcsL family [Stappia sp. ES.058]
MQLTTSSFDSAHDETLSALWSDLEERGCSTAFQSLAFIQSLEDTVARERDGEPFYIAILDPADGRALMIVPLTARKTVGFRRIDFLDHGMADHEFPLVSNDVANNPALAEHLRQAFYAALPPHDVLIMPKLIREFCGVPNPLWSDRRMIETRDGSSRIDLDADSLARDRSDRSVYAKMAKQRAKLEKLPDFEIVEAKTPREIDSILNAMASQRLKRFSNYGANDPLQDAAVFSHCRRLAINGCASGKILLHGLRVGDEWIATSYCLCHKNVVTGTLCSISEGRYKKHSPGLIASVLEIEWAQRNGFALYDFGAGTYNYKDRFGGSHRPMKAMVNAATHLGALYRIAWKARLALRFWLTDRPALHTWLRLRKSALLRMLGRDTGSQGMRADRAVPAAGRS